MSFAVEHGYDAVIRTVASHIVQLGCHFCVDGERFVVSFVVEDGYDAVTFLGLLGRNICFKVFCLIRSMGQMLIARMLLCPYHVLVDNAVL